MLSYDSDAGWRVLFPVVLPDFHTADFPADGFGELINKFDDTRVFVGSRHFLHMVLQLLDKLFFGACLVLFCQHNRSFYHLAADFIGHTGKATRGNVVCQGQYGLVALEPAWISSTQIEAARVAMTRYIKRGGKVWIKIFPDKPVTEKPAETRMGSGKGSPEYWVAVVKPGRVLFELADVDEATAREALRLAMHKLPIKCKFVVREDSVKEDGTNEG